MKILTVTWVLLFGVLQLDIQAEIVIFRSIATTTVIGEGEKMKVKETIHGVGDLETGESRSISAFTVLGRNYYSIDTNSNGNDYVITEKIGARKTITSSVSLFTKRKMLPTGAYVDMQGFSKGRNTIIRVSGNRYIFHPKSFKATGHSVSEGPNGVFLSDYSSRSLYLEKDTLAANASGSDMDQVISKIRSDLIAKGFVKVPDVIEVP